MGGKAWPALLRILWERGGTGPARRLFIPLFSPWLKPNQGGKSRICPCVAFTPQFICAAQQSENPSANIVLTDHARSAWSFGHSVARPRRAQSPAGASSHCGPAAQASDRSRPCGSTPRAAFPARRRGGPGPARPPAGGLRQYLRNRARASSKLNNTSGDFDYTKPTPASPQTNAWPLRPACSIRNRRSAGRRGRAVRAARSRYFVGKQREKRDGSRARRLPFRRWRGISRGRGERFARTAETWPRG